MTAILLSQALAGYRLDAHARRISPRTLDSYELAFDRFLNFMSDTPVDAIEPDDVRRFIDHLSGTPMPTTNPIIKRGPISLSNKTLQNHYTALSSLWTWLVAEKLADTHIVRQVTKPKAEQRERKPYSQQDIEAMLSVCKRSRAYSRPGKRECSNRRSTANRDKAIVLLFLDTGIRANELRNIQLRDVDKQSQTIRVFGKGSKERYVPISHVTLKAIWRLLTARPDATPNDYVFLSSKRDTQLTESGLYQLIRNTGNRAGIIGAHPHRFRHTFAINFLRNSGDIYTLKRILGHTTLEMVQTYLALAQTDVETAHRRASPVLNWSL